MALEKLMQHIAEEELNHEGGQAQHSFHPEPFPHGYEDPSNETTMSLEPFCNEMMLNGLVPMDALVASKHFLPCHYFGFIAGSSTGGSVKPGCVRWRALTGAIGL